MLLDSKVAVVYGAGPIGGAVARGFAHEGARVFVANRTKAKADAVVADILAAGGQAESAEVDALDEAAVEAFVDGVVGRAGRIDISFNLIGYGDDQRPLAELSAEDFLRPIVNAMRSHFLTERAAIRHMRRQGGGSCSRSAGAVSRPCPVWAASRSRSTRSRGSVASGRSSTAGTASGS
jgi:NAD(P)-dependent dehydrogenase (short-subunit alcohol dehydrogenase family)